MNRYAFTLVELMISMALGAVIVFTAVAGFRSASGMIAYTQRQARTNAVLRASMLYAFELADNRYGDISAASVRQRGQRMLPTSDASVVPADWPVGSVQFDLDGGALPHPTNMGLLLWHSWPFHEGIAIPFGVPVVPPEGPFTMVSKKLGPYPDSWVDFSAYPNNDVEIWNGKWKRFMGHERGAAVERANFRVEASDRVTGETYGLYFAVPAATGRLRQ
ncbi:MAG: prepilin-type N-terminal cleavage/methylation domain-containing protein [Planctomycetota bacterium]|jgi:prepilin-type N-terminal cleavage/methylation domain-containing protein|nr:prepilin-type N-terminal cleavage/methylation domain-containing protein [Planctomycetota bacterium]